MPVRRHDPFEALHALEAQSARNTCLTRLDVGAKLVVLLCYLVCVASVERHSPSVLAAFVLLPVLAQAAGEVPVRLLRAPLLTALPFCGMAALTTLLLERGTLLQIGSLRISYGLAAFCVILGKTLLCVWAVVLLTATTPLQQLTAQLLRWRVPARLVTQLRMTYRYLFLLAGEAARMQTAYRLRGGTGGVALGRMGAFVGTLLLRCTRRATQVEHAMQCRGATPGTAAGLALPARPVQRLGAGAVCVLLVLLRVGNVSVWLGRLLV